MLGVMLHLIYKTLISTITETERCEDDKTVVKLTNVHGVTVRKIRDLFGPNEFECMKTFLLDITNPCRKRCPSSENLKEILLFGNTTDYNCGASFYASTTVSDEYKVVDHDEFAKLIITYGADDLCFKDNRDKILNVFLKPFIQMIERLCKHNRKSGTIKFRASVKLFIGNYGTTKHSLGWHYDFGAKSTITVELINDFADIGSLMFAKNRYENCTGKYGCNTKEIDVMDDTIMTVNYEPNCGIMFDGQRGAQIHKPADVEVPKIQTGESNMRAVMQIVLYDDEWMKPK
jgi:hypothetical protein